MIFNGQVQYKNQWYGIRADFFVDDVGETPSAWNPGQAPSLYFEEVHIEDEEGNPVSTFPSEAMEKVEYVILETMTADEETDGEIERTIYLN